MIFAMHDPLADLLGEWSRGLNTGSVLLRIALAVLLASVIGCERSSKRHSAGLRTFVLVSFASTVSMLLDVYLMSNFGARLPILSAATVIAAALRPWEGVIAADTGHINVHETGAIEGSGHKVLVAEGREGKVSAEGVRAVCACHTDEHMVHPRLLYISQPTEIGTVYSLAELRALRAVCDEQGLILFVDGARLGSALTSEGCDVTLSDLAALADCFYIGGTKNGLLFGEAMVIVNPALQKDFRFMIKNRGGMMAKGRLCGLMFLTALEHDDYFAWARHANEMADIVRGAMRRAGISSFQQTATNQLFPIVAKDQRSKLEERVAFERWGDLPDGRCVIRFVTSWATQREEAEALADILEAL